MKRLPLLLVSLAASTAFATTYVRVEKDGTKTYSDRPLPGGQPVEISEAQTYSAPKIQDNSNLPPEQRALQGIDDFSYTSCSLTPENDATFTNPENVPINVSTVPELRAGDEIELVVDGKPAAGASTSFILAPVFRGAHTVQLTIKDGYGRVLCSASTTFHVFRPSVNLPGRR